MKSFIPIAFLLACAGCVTIQPQPAYQISTAFDITETRRLLLPGKNSIKGNAFLRQRGGGVVTCAGSVVRLFPGTGYAKERIQRIWGSSALMPANAKTPRVTPDVEEFHELSRTARCDAQGNFVFDDVQDGTFIIQTDVVWHVGSEVQGGSLVQIVPIAGGKSVTIVVSN